MSATQFRAAVEAKDHEGMVAALSPDVVFHSPVTFKPFEGKEAVGFVLGAVMQVFEDFTYTDELREGETTALVFEARVGDRSVQGIDLVREDADGLIEDFTVLVRPLSGLTALAEEMGRSASARDDGLPRAGLERRRPAGEPPGRGRRAAGARREVLASSSTYDTDPVGEVLDQPRSSTRASGSRPTSSPSRCSTPARRSSASSAASPAASATARARSTSTSCCSATASTAPSA